MLKEHHGLDSWETKPTDRFVLKWIKCHLSARITPKLVAISWLRPWMITVSAAILGVAGGTIFAIGLAWLAGLFALVSQILDGVDGQFARLTNRQSVFGAFLDSVLDRYPDGAMIIGMVIYLARLPVSVPLWLLVLAGSAALIGSNLISYSTLRADNLEIDLGDPTLANKGTRTTVMALCGIGSLIWASMPMLALFYLVFHTNAVVAKRLIWVFKSANTVVSK